MHELTVEYGIGELCDPVAEYNHACTLGQLQVEFDMPVAVDEEVDVGMSCNVLLGVEYQMLAVFPHVCGLLGGGMLHAAVLGPCQSEPHCPAGMQH